MRSLSEVKGVILDRASVAVVVAAALYFMGHLVYFLLSKN